MKTDFTVYLDNQKVRDFNQLDKARVFAHHLDAAPLDGAPTVRIVGSGGTLYSNNTAERGAVTARNRATSC